jgi:hypothetical protein
MLRYIHAKIEQLNLAFLGYLGQLKSITVPGQDRISRKIGNGIERESKVILDTYDKIAPLYQRQIRRLQHERHMTIDRQNQYEHSLDFELDYTLWL